MNLERLLKFGLVGGGCGALQMAMLYFFVHTLNWHSPWQENAANVISFALSVQLNFWLSTNYTWKDRLTPNTSQLFQRWLSFNTMMVATLLVNQAAFAISNLYAPALVAGVVGLAFASVANLVFSNLFVFRSPPSRQFN